MSDQVQSKTARNAGRSPSYPDIDLEQALIKAQQLYEVEKQNWAPIDAILSHWGLKNTGTSRRSVAALKSFGLLDYEGKSEQRQARLTDFAIRIIIDDRPLSLDRDLAIKEAALLPPIHAELWHEYNGDLPSDTTLRFKLRTDRHFSEAGANSLISQFKRTIEFAKLGEARGASDAQSDKVTFEPDAELTKSTFGAEVDDGSPTEYSHSGQRNNRQEPIPNSDSDTRTVMLPLPNDGWAVLRYRYPLTEDDWSAMTKVLDAMKPSIVVSKTETPTLSSPAEVSTTS